MIAWYTNHFISQKIMRSVAIGFKCIAKDTSLFKEGIKKGMFKDEAILYGILRGCSDVIHHNFKNGLDYLHLDLGYIKRSLHNNGQFDGYYKISLNDTQAHYKDINLPEDRLKKLDIVCKDWQNNKNGYFLICPPTDAICIFYGIDVKKWIDTTIHKLGDRHYKIREKNDVSMSVSLKDDLAGAKAVITFNSNVALDATLEGIPVIATSQHSVIKNWNNLTMSNLDNCIEISQNLDRDKLLRFISYHQFTLKEIENGLAFAIIKKMREQGAY